MPFAFEIWGGYFRAGTFLEGLTIGNSKCSVGQQLKAKISSQLTKEEKIITSLLLASNDFSWTQRQNLK